MSRIYVASSWRNDTQPSVVERLRAEGHEVYDFKNPTADNHGFHWTDVGMASYDRATNSDVPVQEYLDGIEHPIALAGFKSDFDAMQWADTCVLVLPCGRSAHLELGWFVGAGRRTCILLDGPLVTPELMYRMVDHLASDLDDVVTWLGGSRSAALLPGTRLRSRNSGHVVTLDRRKVAGESHLPGWWLTDGAGGLADIAIDGSDGWDVLVDA